MPELPDVELYVEHLTRRLAGRTLERVRLASPILAVHLMIAGRFHWKDVVNAPVPKKVGLAAFDVQGATLLLTEASPKKRAALHVVATQEELGALSRGGIEPLEAGLAVFAAALRAESHTVKRAVQRLVYAANEANYCATCQTGGRLLADRALSRLLKDDWPGTLEELEEARAARREL